METDTALVGANGVVVLYTVTGVDLYLAVVVNPCDAECEYTVGDTEPLDEVVCLEFGVLVVLLLNGVQHLFNSLEILRLMWKLFLQILKCSCYFHMIMCYISFWCRKNNNIVLKNKEM